MKIDSALQAHVRALFEPLNREAAANAFPPPASLSHTLNAALPSASTGVSSRDTSRDVAKMFATASVNMWMRATHSFLISASLTDVSAIWASVTGYYSSHYAVRALAHVLGFFQLFGRRRIVQLQFQGGRCLCTFDPKKATDREHRLYWRIVKKDRHFAADPFFTDNDAIVDESDVGHRDRANYADHLPHFPVFHPLDAAALRARIERISDIEFSSPPIPRISKYPDVESVQIVAYHRLVRFRDLLDAIMGDENRFWNVHCNPTWARDFMDFQLTEEETLRAQFLL